MPGIQFMLYLFVFLFGLAVGSFLNVLIIRLGGEEKRGIGGRSHCPKCAHQLAWQDLVPVLSFFWLLGKCRYCRERISLQYPIIELATGLLFLIILNFQSPVFSDFLNFQLSNLIQLIFWWFIASCLIVIFVSDLKFFIIPDEIILAGIIGFFVFKLFGILNLGFVSDFKILLNPLLSAIIASAFFLLIVLVTRGKGMGLGDVKLVFLMGLVLGWPQIFIALLLAFVSGALVGLGLILAGRAKMKSEIPFGTFLAAATFFVILFGENILGRFLISLI